MNLESVLSQMDWSKPEVSQGKALVKANPTKAFWDLWRQDKRVVKSSGIFVTKEGDKFFVYRYMSIDVVYSGSKRPLVKQHKVLKYSKKLFEYQHKHTLNLVNALLKHGAALDGSDTGTGKTLAALGACRELKLTPFVVCPKNAISVWRKWAKYMGVKGLVAINYEKLKTWRTEHLMYVGERYREMEWLVSRQGTLMIFDEAHRCKDYRTINSKLLIHAKWQGYKILCLSATIADNPLQMKGIGFTLNLFPRIQDFWSWVRAHGCYKNAFGAFEFSGSDLMLQKIHSYIYPERGSRMRVCELGDAFPENKIIAEPYTMENASKIQKVYQEMQVQLDNLDKKCMLDGESELTIKLRARQRVELLKVPTFVEMAKDLLDEGHSVGIFINFTETLKTLAEKLKTDCVVYGEQIGIKGEREREANINAFQSDKERLIIVNIQAGGEVISLHDLHGNHSRVSLISPTWSAQNLIQVLGRMPRSGAKSKVIQRIIFAAKTIEETIAEAVSKKIDRIKTLNDGDLTKGIEIKRVKETII